MIEALAKATPTDYAAWVGAVVAVLVLIWDIIKWMNEGARLRVEVATDMEILTVDRNGNPLGKRGSFIMITVSNVGDRPTTITGVYGEEYHRRRFRKIGKGLFVRPLDGNGNTALIPHELGPGQRWVGLVIQDELLKAHQEGKSITLGVGHSSSRKGKYVPVKFKAQSDINSAK